MTNENKKSKLGLFDYPEPAADFNNQISEASIDKSAAAYKAQRPDDTEFFRCFDPKGDGNVDDIKKYLTVSVPVKHRKTEYLVAGPPEFLRQVKADFSKVRIIRPAYYETSAGRVGIWPVPKINYNKDGNISNAWVASANTILEQSLTKWVRIVSNMEVGYYDGFFADPRKVEVYVEQGKPHFKEDYETVLEKAYDGFILTPDTYDKDECVQEFLGEKLKQDLYDAKGKKIN
jgi:hypothetical protein